MNDPSANLMDSYIGLVRALAWKIHQQLPRNVEIDDLIGYGCVGLAEAARSFNPNLGHKFSTFAYHRIRGAILDGLSQMTWFRMDKFEGRSYQASAEGEDQAEPQVEIDAEQTLNANGGWFRSAADRMERSMRSGGPDGQPEAIDRTISPEDAVMGREAEMRLRELVEALPAAASDLIKATYYEGLTLKDAAARIGRDKSWASRLHARILQKLAASLKAEGYA
jgi:RNA polymerase sigma factor for flagellar operon FliA